MKANSRKSGALMISLFAVCAFLSGLKATEPKPLGVPQIEDLVQPWIFVRASEASTLFIDETLKGREPYGHLIILGKNEFQWLEYDGRSTTLWNVTDFERNDRQLTLHLRSVGGEQSKALARLVVYPYWDIDHCLVMIRFDPGAEENPVRFSTPYSFKAKLPYLVADG